MRSVHEAYSNSAWVMVAGKERIHYVIKIDAAKRCTDDERRAAQGSSTEVGNLKKLRGSYLFFNACKRP